MVPHAKDVVVRRRPTFLSWPREWTVLPLRMLVVRSRMASFVIAPAQYVRPCHVVLSLSPPAVLPLPLRERERVTATPDGESEKARGDG